MKALIRLGSILTVVACAFASTLPAHYPFDVTEIKAPDGSVTAKFVSLGATMTELWVKDRGGKPRDIILGYDDNTKLLTDPNHPYFNPIVGRYANRIKNGTFSIPITRNPQPPGPNVFQLPNNEHDGQDLLHSGIFGWDRLNWTISARSPSSVTYKFVDNVGGFPGTVTAFVTYAVFNGGIYKTSIHGQATKKTPIMATQHVYFNLDAFQNGAENILEHHLQADASRVVDLDSILVPLGDFIHAPGTPFDFRKEHKIGKNWDATKNLCGPGCQGFDHCWIYDHSESSRPRISVWSDNSGIRVDMFTNQPAVQIYTGNFLGTLNIPRKAVHGGPGLTYPIWSSVVIEQEGLIDAINNPQWGVDQIYGPGRDFEWSTTYKFSVVH